MLALTKWIVNLGFIIPVFFKGVQLFFSAIIIGLFNTLLKRLNVSRLARIIGVFHLIASPFLFSCMFFWNNVFNGFVALFFLVSLLLILSETKHTLKRNTVLAFIVMGSALLSSEIGLVVPGIYAVYFLYNSRYKSFVGSVLLVIGYFVLRMFVFEHLTSQSAFISPTGYFFNGYSVVELQDKFGHFPYIIYLYTAISNVFFLMFNQPSYGVLGFKPFPLLKLFRFCLYVFSTGMIVVFLKNYFKQHAAFSINIKKIQLNKKCQIFIVLLLAIIANSFIGYSYSRARTLAVGGVAYAVLFAISFDFLLSYLNSIKTKFSVKQHMVNILVLGLLVGYSVHLFVPVISLYSKGKYSNQYTDMKKIQSVLDLPSFPLKGSVWDAVPSD